MKAIVLDYISVSVGENELIAKINQENRLMYYFAALNGLSTRIMIQEDWAKYITKNQEIIKGWLEYNMILYIQKRNPSVPGIADKLYPPQERKPEKIKKYWKLILTLEPVREIYDEQMLTEKDISIDHFVPWSYVAHDEMWNLNPTTKSINSSKSNNLPDWKTYFGRLANRDIDLINYYGSMMQFIGNLKSVQKNISIMKIFVIAFTEKGLILHNLPKN